MMRVVYACGGVHVAELSPCGIPAASNLLPRLLPSFADSKIQVVSEKSCALVVEKLRE